jgi:hypothetical protein
MTVNSAARVSGKPDVNMFLYRDGNELGAPSSRVALPPCRAATVPRAGAARSGTVRRLHRRCGADDTVRETAPCACLFMRALSRARV